MMMSQGKKCVFVTWLCTSLLLSCMFTNIEGRKYASSSNSRRPSSKTSHSPSSQSGRVNKPADTSHTDAAKLSYSGYNSQPNPPRAAQQPSAPVHTAPASSAGANQQANKPIGWNVPAHSDAGGIQKQSATHTQSAYPGKYYYL